MTQLAEVLDKIIRERQGYLPTNDNDQWLEEKANELRKVVDKETPTIEKGREYLYILDYCDEDLIRIDTTDMEDDDLDRILKPFGLNSTSCGYMWSSRFIDKVKDGNEYLEH